MRTGRRCRARRARLGRAVALADETTNFGDPNLVNLRYQKMSAVTKADIQRVAKMYLTEEQSHGDCHRAQEGRRGGAAQAVGDHHGRS